MTTIQIQKHNKELLKEYGDGSFDNRINQLMQDIKEYVPLDVMDTPTTSMRVDEDTIELLKSFRITPKESYENIIVRLLLLAKTLNINDE